MKLLVNAPTGIQEVISLGEGGGYFDVSRVLWDERVDGPLPPITLGGMVRIGDSLVLDEALLASANQAKKAIENAKHNASIKSQILAIDQKRIRPVSETVSGVSMAGDLEKLKSLNDQITALRAQLI